MLATSGALSASEICEPFDVAQPTISKHLKVLERAGLVSRAVEGRMHRFRLQPSRMHEAEDWLVRHRTFWESTLEHLEDFVKSIDQRVTSND